MASKSNRSRSDGDVPPVRTFSLCPVCLSRIHAQRRRHGDEVWLHKHCPKHGAFVTPVWRGAPELVSWRRPKVASPPTHGRRPVVRGCPFDCGLCSDHRQRSCTVLLEVTQRCNLVCPVCFAGAGGHALQDPDLDELKYRFDTLSRLSPGSNIQLSGGEPTLRNDLPKIITIAKQAGFPFIQINTNGIRPAEEAGYLGHLAEAGLDSLFLQFDGTQDAIFEKLRGRALLHTKLRTISESHRAGLGVVLVVTVAPGVNDHNLGDILNLAMDHAPTVRGVHFQPISYFGRYPESPAPRDRITLPELMRAIDNQSHGAFPMGSFSPPGCEHTECSFSAKFLITGDHRVQPLLPAWQGCCGPPERADHAALRSISQTAHQWAAPPADVAPMTDGNPCRKIHPSTSIDPGDPPVMDLDAFLHLARTRTLSVSAMAFQDAWTLDLDRVRECCIHVMDDRHRLVPFCLYNLTNTAGKALYRP